MILVRVFATFESLCFRMLVRVIEIGSELLSVHASVLRTESIETIAHGRFELLSGPGTLLTIYSQGGLPFKLSIYLILGERVIPRYHVIDQWLQYRLQTIVLLPRNKFSIRPEFVPFRVIHRHK